MPYGSRAGARGGVSRASDDRCRLGRFQYSLVRGMAALEVGARFVSAILILFNCLGLEDSGCSEKTRYQSSRVRAGWGLSSQPENRPTAHSLKPASHQNLS